MLTEEEFELFKRFRIKAMGDKLREMVEDASYDRFSFEEKMKILIDTEKQARQERKIVRFVRQAEFKLPGACIEDIVYLPERTLIKDRVMRWAQCEWVKNSETMVIISKTGCGKSFLAQALGNAACRKLYSVRYRRLAGICDDLNRARMHQDRRYYDIRDDLANVDLLIIDDFMTTPISVNNVVDLFEIMEAREGRKATLITSQLEPDEWYLRIEGELMADSILNRIATGAHYVDLDGPNMREYFSAKRKRED